MDYTPNTNASAPYYEVPVSCGAHKDTLRLLPSEKTVEIRVYTDVTFTETFFQGGRVAITTTGATDNSSTVTLTSTTAATAASATVYVQNGNGFIFFLKAVYFRRNVFAIRSQPLEVV